ncbi:MAG: tRNA-dihydrouridine synthase family protein [Proteobacteria bacterium]|nr:tRNA-dihydrouridine synthase family protein [Pseudomonadota bacterium]
MLKNTRDNSAQLPSRVRWGLAPMEGVTDFAMRIWFGLTSPPAFVWTPFLRVTDTFPASIPDHYAPELNRLRTVVPFKIIPQLMGPSVTDFCRAADLLLKNADFVDLNCGCPSPTVVGNRSGSSLLQHVDTFAAFVSKASQHCGAGKVSVKMRTGYDHCDEFRSLVRSIAGVPLAQLTIHGRTRPQRYRGHADWVQIGEATGIVPFDVVGSGDVVDAASAWQKLDIAPKVKTVIVGRGALRNPWIFGEVKRIPLVEPLIVFALLQDISLAEPLNLIRFAQEGGIVELAGGDLTRWLTVFHSLRKIAGITTGRIQEVEVSTRALARVKMLWSYLRSSLPECFMEPTILRARSLSDLCQILGAVAGRHNINLESVPLHYRSDLDWLYSGEGRNQKVSIL